MASPNEVAQNIIACISQAADGLTKLKKEIAPIIENMTTAGVLFETYHSAMQKQFEDFTKESRIESNNLRSEISRLNNHIDTLEKEVKTLNGKVSQHDSDLLAVFAKNEELTKLLDKFESK